jgi:hypothetical protein
VNKKKVFFFSSILILAVTFLCSSLTFAQELRYWDYCKVSAYGYNFAEMETGDIRTTSFNVATPPSGSDITNTVEVINYDTGENYTKTFSIDDAIIIRYDNYPPLNYTATEAAESNHYIIYFEGSVANVSIRGAAVPEFPPILIVPLFITATLLALIYRRKHSS